MVAHAKLSASSAERWANCPGSVAAVEGMPNNSSPAAFEGTLAHELAEHCLTAPASPFDYVGKDHPTQGGGAFGTVGAEMASHVQTYIDYVGMLPGEHRYEVRLDFSEWVPEGFGTADCIAVDAATKTLYVADLKYGKGVQKYAQDNPQLLLYGLGAYAEYAYLYDIETVVMAIVQPRLDHIDETTISVADLLKWGEWISERANATLDKYAPRIPGKDQCMFCPAKARCPALDKLTTDTLLIEFDDLDDNKPARLTDERLRQVMESKDLITSWLNAVEDEIRGKLEAGKPFAGFKLVAGRSLRKWSDETAAATLLESLGHDAYERSLISPAKAEKALGRKGAAALGDLILKPQGRPVLARESDKRPSINVSETDFDCFTSDES
jgi:hypothetical protein